MKALWDIQFTVGHVNILRPRQMAVVLQTTFKRIFVYENVWILIEMSPNFVP